jgi:hypothetical protein
MAANALTLHLLGHSEWIAEPRTHGSLFLLDLAALNCRDRILYRQRIRK